MSKMLDKLVIILRERVFCSLGFWQNRVWFFIYDRVYTLARVFNPAEYPFSVKEANSLVNDLSTHLHDSGDLTVDNSEKEINDEFVFTEDNSSSNVKTFVIEAKCMLDRLEYLPAQSFGYTAIESMEYKNWYNQDKHFKYVLNDNLNFKGEAFAKVFFDEFNIIDIPYYNYLRHDCVPIGSVEYVLSWLSLMGVKDVLPLNIPEELWKYVHREVQITSPKNCRGHWHIKSTKDIKSEKNCDMQITSSDCWSDDDEYFMTRWVDNVVSEWRVFVYNKKILGIRCYSGDEWKLPDRIYIGSIVNAYDKKCYTLDVMVYEGIQKSSYRQSLSYITDIVELHDFFSCGLYGFEDLRYLPNMWCTAINDLLKKAD